MPIIAYAKIEGEKQGLISSGASTSESIGKGFQEGFEDEIRLETFEHVVDVPRNEKTGQPAGQRTHKPLSFTKSIDKSSPLIYNALSTGENLSNVEIKFYRINTQGSMEHYFTTTLTDANIVSVDTKVQEVDSVPNIYEKIAISYRKIDWTHEVAGTSGSDDWRSAMKA